MSAQHTQGPLQHRHLDYLQICDTDGEKRGCAPVARVTGGKNGETRAEARANARRLVACWNACLGLTTENLERYGTLDRASVASHVRRDELQRDRDELLSALKELIAADQWLSGSTLTDDPSRDGNQAGERMERALDAARAAIAKATGAAS